VNSELLSQHTSYFVRY